jgi:hypothetical protein
MTMVRRLAIALPIVLATVAVIYAVKPFSVTDVPLTDASGQRFVALTSSSTCGVPIVSAWHGKDDVFAVPVGPGVGGYEAVPASNQNTTVIETVRILTCRGEGQHRLRVAGLFLTAAVALGALVFIGRRKVGFGPTPSPV